MYFFAITFPRFTSPVGLASIIYWCVMSLAVVVLTGNNKDCNKVVVLHYKASKFRFESNNMTMDVLTNKC